MSRRYGRNQKRRARAEIAQLEQKATELQAAMVLDRALLRHQTQKINELQSRLEDVARIMGTNFIGLEPALWKFQEKHQINRFRCPVDGGDVVMHTMMAGITKDQFRPDYMVHFRVDLAGESVGYTISEVALRHGPEEYIARRISEEMAQMLVRDLRKKLGRPDLGGA